MNPSENKYGTTESAGTPQIPAINDEPMSISVVPGTGHDMDSIQYWQKAIMSWADSKGWNQGLDERSFGDWIALLHTEISEAYEDYRDGYNFDEIYYEDVQGHKVTREEMIKRVRAWRNDESPLEEERPRFKPCGIPIEIADLLIRCFHLAEYFDFNLAQMINDKMEYNQGRPFRHGGKKV